MNGWSSDSLPLAHIPPLSIRGELNFKSNKKSEITFDYYRTDFVNQIVVDWENPREVNFYSLKGKSFALENLETNIKGNVTYLEYNSYRYNGIAVSGDIGKNIFNGKLNTQDPNIILDFNGLADMSQGIRKFDFNANVTYADLRALNFVIRDSISEFRGIVDMAVTGSSYDNLRGKINVKK